MSAVQEQEIAMQRLIATIWLGATSAPVNQDSLVMDLIVKVNLKKFHN